MDEKGVKKELKPEYMFNGRPLIVETKRNYSGYIRMKEGEW